MTWSNGKVTEALITSKGGNKCRVIIGNGVHELDLKPGKKAKIKFAE